MYSFEIIFIVIVNIILAFFANKLLINTPYIFWYLETGRGKGSIELVKGRIKPFLKNLNIIENCFNLEL